MFGLFSIGSAAGSLGESIVNKMMPSRNNTHSVDNSSNTTAIESFQPISTTHTSTEKNSVLALNILSKVEVHQSNGYNTSSSYDLSKHNK